MITRRDFLKISAISSLFLFAPANELVKAAAVEAVFNGRIYRGTFDGKIFVSADKRKTWKRHANLGASCTVMNFVRNGNKSLQVQVSYRGHPFSLSLAADAKKWLVA
jgi:hypothetical protein